VASRLAHFWDLHKQKLPRDSVDAGYQKLQVGKSSFEVNLKARRQTWSRALVSRAIPPVKQFDPRAIYTYTRCWNFKKGDVLGLGFVVTCRLVTAMWGYGSSTWGAHMPGR
jgi:hypothetical protein